MSLKPLDVVEQERLTAYKERFGVVLVAGALNESMHYEEKARIFSALSGASEKYFKTLSTQFFDYATLLEREHTRAL